MLAWDPIDGQDAIVRTDTKIWIFLTFGNEKATPGQWYDLYIYWKIHVYIYTSIINQMYIYKYVYIYIIFIYIHCQIFVGTLLTKLLTVCHRMSRTLFWRKDQQTTCRWHSHCSCIWTQLKGIWVWSLFSATSHNWSRTIAILDSQLANEG